MENAHVVVEDGMVLAVLLQQSVCIGYSEVFEVQKAVWMVFPDELDESKID